MNERRPDGVGHDVDERDAQVAGARTPRRLNVRSLAGFKNGAAHDSQEKRNIEEREGRNDVFDAGAREADKGQRKHENRERLEHVGRAHDPDAAGCRGRLLPADAGGAAPGVDR